MMKRIVAVALCALSLCAVCGETEVFRLLRDKDSGATFVVGVDGVERPCQLLTLEQFYAVTNMVEKWYAQMNSTKEGRKSLHGDRVGQPEVTTNDVGIIVKRQKYEDGYVHEETGRVMPKARRATAKVLPDAPPAPRAIIVKPSNISQRQFEMRQARERAKKGIPKTVTIHHDATTGKDEVVE